MNYVVIDLEWNQAMSSKAAIFNKLPIHLRGEIIEIGAVKLDENFRPGEEFTVDVRPIYFKRMHYKVKKLTGFDAERLSHGIAFEDAFQQFREWCGDEVTFLTWGYDDQGIMEQNIIIHDLDWDWIHEWINLQLIYNNQTGGDKNQKSLATAMEHFGIEQTRVAHDALGDAYNTALICTHLDLAFGIEHYDEAKRILSSPKPSAGNNEREPIEHIVFPGYYSKSDAFADDGLISIPCPTCQNEMTHLRWINQGDQRYMNLYTCAEDGKYLVRVKFRKMDDDSWVANRLIYEADPKLIEFYKAKATQARRHGRGHSKKKSIAANV